MNIFSIARNMLPMTRYPYRGERVACPVCGEAKSDTVSDIDRRLKRLPTVMCTRCGLLYTNPMPTEAELATYYQHYYRFDYQLVATKPTRRHIAKRSAEAAARAAAVQDLLPAGGRTLDFGAGSGEFVELMLGRGFDAHGFEPGGTYATHAIQRLGSRMRAATWQEVAYEGRFDLVTCFHVMEHLSTPMAAMRRIASWLAPAGKAYIEVPDTPAWLGQKGLASLHFAHVVGFNHDNLRLAAAQAGLKVLRTVSPTGLILERGEVPPEEQAAMAAAGLATSRAIFANASPAAIYIGHQLSKIGLRAASRVPK